jgi:hypothetical protein
MEMVQYDVRIEGLRALLVHNNSRLVNPLDPLTIEIKQLTGIRKKTEEHHRRIADLEFIGGLYLDDKSRPIMPAANIEAMISEAGRKHRLGKDVKAGLQVDDDPLIEHDGPKNATCEALISLERFRNSHPAKVGMATVMRTRPCFPKWAITFRLSIDPEVMKPTDLPDIMRTAGGRIGIGDWRPRYGKFTVTKLKEVK